MLIDRRFVLSDVSAGYIIYIRRFKEDNEMLLADVIDCTRMEGRSWRSGNRQLYDMHKVTGTNPALLAVVANQSATVDCLQEAIFRFETDQSGSGPNRSIAFACDHGTPPSVAAAFLLIALAYPDAKVVPATERVAIDWGRLFSG